MLQKNNLVKNLSYGITAYLFVFSYALCFAVSLQLNIWYALTTAIISIIISVSLKNQILAPDTFFIVPLLLVLSSGTNALLPFTVIGGGLIFLFLNKKSGKLKLHPAIKSGLSLSLAFAVTALLTTHYFGIGAEGFTVIEILKGAMPMGMDGSFNLCDVRDLAAGCIGAADFGKKGESYILANEEVSFREFVKLICEESGCKPIKTFLPLGIAYKLAAMMEKSAKKTGKEPLMTTFSVYNLDKNNSFDYSKAQREIGYKTRPYKETIKDEIAWLKANGQTPDFTLE